MKKVLLHDQMYSIGGPKVVLDGIINSCLKDEFDFVRLEQEEACGFNPIKAFAFILKYRAKISKEHADVIYICGLQYTGLLMTIASKLSNVKKVVLSVHGSDWDNPNNTLRKWILMHIIEPLEIRLADSVFTVCESAQRIIKPLHNRKNNSGVVYNTFPSVKYESVPSGLLRRELSIPEDKIIVVSVGRVVEAKGHGDIIGSIKSLNDDSFVFVIVGDGPYLTEYENKCKHEIENRRLFLLGRRTDVNSILKDSDVFLFATHNENHSIALLEAVNMQCAVACSHIGGNPEIIRNGVTGITFKKGDVGEICCSLISLKDENLRKRYAVEAYNECVDKFSVENTYGKLGRIFDN